MNGNTSLLFYSFFLEEEEEEERKNVFHSKCAVILYGVVLIALLLHNVCT
jgi:hypothetical protein